RVRRYGRQGKGRDRTRRSHPSSAGSPWSGPENWSRSPDSASAHSQRAISFFLGNGGDIRGFVRRLLGSFFGGGWSRGGSRRGCGGRFGRGLGFLHGTGRNHP